MKGRLLRLWQRANLWSVTVEGAVTWWCSDDTHQRERKVDMEVRWPKWIWRPFCWHRRAHEPFYYECLYCGAPTGKPNPSTCTRDHQMPAGARPGAAAADVATASGPPRDDERAERTPERDPDRSQSCCARLDAPGGWGHKVTVEAYLAGPYDLDGRAVIEQMDQIDRLFDGAHFIRTRIEPVASQPDLPDDS